MNREQRKKAQAKAARRAKHEENVAVKTAVKRSRPLVGTRPMPELIADLDARFLVGGELQVVPAEAYDAVDRTDLQIWCHRHGFYGLPTTELVAWLADRICRRTALEVGAGNGALGRALGIPVTDSWMQSDPGVAALYALQGQPTVVYGSDVERIEALDAVQKYQPEVVIGCWVTHWIDPHKPMPIGGGCMFGIREDRLLRLPSVLTYIVVGNTSVHAHKPILHLSHEVFRPPWIRSRAADPTGDAIFVWDRP